MLLSGIYHSVEDYRRTAEPWSAAIFPSEPSPESVEEEHSRGCVREKITRSLFRSLWNLQGLSIRAILQHTWISLFNDNLAGRAAELAFYFLFALFPCLFTVTSLLGLAAHSASHIYYSLLEYLSVVLPQAAMGTVLQTFDQITAISTGGKLTFGMVASLWSASVGFSAIQDGLNAIYQVKESRSYIRAKASSIGVTVLLSMLVTVVLAILLGADYFGRMAHVRIHPELIAVIAIYTVKCLSWLFAVFLLSLIFAVVYYFAPDVKSQWHWFTPGSAIGVLGWLLVSMGFRIYVHVVGNFAGTYGSLGAVTILLTWFYLSGLVLLIGAKINREIEADTIGGEN